MTRAEAIIAFKNGEVHLGQPAGVQPWIGTFEQSGLIVYRKSDRCAAYGWFLTERGETAVYEQEELDFMWLLGEKRRY
jgi:hypothetical protein